MAGKAGLEQCMPTRQTVIHGDSRNMELVADHSVHLVVTSPPYWQLKDYGADNQIGFCDTYSAYINHLNLVWQECERVLHKGCRLCINIGDQFARSAFYGRYKVIPIRTQIIRFCETIGLDYMGAVIWQKATTTNTTGGGSVMGSFPYPRNGILKIDYEFILIFKKRGNSPPVSQEIKEASALTQEQWNRYFAGHWVFPGERQKEFLAAFPLTLPQRLIRMFTFVGETVLDPFLGSGTTSLAAAQNGRNSIGYEINKDNLPLIRSRLVTDQPDIFASWQLVEKQQKNADFDLKKALLGLPYIFSDPLEPKIKANPKKLSYGSKVDLKSAPREKYYTVESVEAPDLIRLKKGPLVHLAGVVPKPETAGEAMDFLRLKTSKTRIFLRFESPESASLKPGEKVQAYVYLKNRTFLNAHLIKRGLAGVDSLSEYSKKARFTKLAIQAGPGPDKEA